MNWDAGAEAERLNGELTAMEGAEVWQVTLGYGSNLFIDLGGKVEQQIRTKTRIIGEWRLWIQLAAWRLHDPLKSIVACEDPRSAIAEKVKILQGLRFTGSTIFPPAMEGVFAFEHVTLAVFPIHSEAGAALEGKEETQWSLWVPRGDIVSVSPGSGEAWTVKSIRDSE